MKKLLLIFAILLVVIPAVFAGGNKEVAASEWGPISNFVYYISSIFDYATSEICIAITPFPSVLNAFTEVEQVETTLSTTAVLTSKPLSQVDEKDFLLINPDRPQFDTTKLSNFFDVSRSGGPLQRTVAQENKIWGMISYLFAIFTVLEVLYVTIRGYLVDEDNLVRKVITRLIVTGILFLVLMALPALVELFRIGFFQMAEVVSTPYAFSEMLDGGKGVEVKSVFQLPGGVLRCTSKLLAYMTPENMGWNLEKEKENGGFSDKIKVVAFNVAYFLLNIYVMIWSLLSAFQIMMNIIEVYLLLAIVMCLVPFQVFSGTRYLVGENMIKSLFSNIIELFVIMIIIGVTANAAIAIGDFGMIYLTNPEYYPVTITLDTSTRGRFFTTGICFFGFR